MKLCWTTSRRLTFIHSKHCLTDLRLTSLRKSGVRVTSISATCGQAHGWLTGLYAQTFSESMGRHAWIPDNKGILESKCCWTNYTCICHITARKRECSLLWSPAESNIYSAHTKHSSSCCNFVQKIMSYHSNLERTALASCFTENYF